MTRCVLGPLPPSGHGPLRLGRGCRAVRRDSSAKGWAVSCCPAFFVARAGRAA